MSAEYMLKMDLLRRNREELTARRQVIERRIALREATAAEYSAVALQSHRQQWKSLRTAAIAAKKRNDEFVREVHDAQRRVNETYLRTKQRLWPADEPLALEKARYFQRVEELYPAWKEKTRTLRVQKLRELEAKKRAIEKRRYLAKKTFETEQTLDDLIRQTSHEIELAENLEKNEAFERDVMRSQSTVQAMQLDHTIREHAKGARMYMKQQAAEHFRDVENVTDDVEGKIFETFSPRGALRAMRESTASLSYVSPAPTDEQSVPRSRTVVFPQPHYREAPPPQIQVQTSRPTQAVGAQRAETIVLEQKPAAPSSSSYLSVGLVEADASRATTKYPASAVATAPYERYWVEQKADHSSYSLADTAHNIATTPFVPGVVPRQATLVHPQQTASSTPLHIHHDESHEQKGAAHFHTTALQATPSLTHSSAAPSGDEQHAVADAFTPASTAPRDLISQVFRHDPPPIVSEERSSPLVSLATIPESGEDEHRSHHAPSDTVRVKTDREHSATSDPHNAPMQEEKELQPQPSPTPAVTERAAPEVARHSFVEVEEKMSKEEKLPPSPNACVQVPLDDVTKPTAETIETALSSESIPSWSPLKSNAADGAMDLSLNLVNSFESNESSLNFSVGKLLDSTRKHDSSFHRKSPHDADVAAPEAHNTPPMDTNDQPMTMTMNSMDSAAETTTVNTMKQDPGVTSTARDTSPAASLADKKLEESVRREERTTATKSGAPHVVQSLVFSSIESGSEFGSPAPRSVQQDTRMSELGSPLEADDIPEVAASTVDETFTQAISPPTSPVEERDALEEPSVVSTLSMPERLKALTGLIARVEEGTADGEQISSTFDSGSSRDTKRELLRMAIGGRKAQINFFGADICFELVVDLARELGPVLFPAKAFEGIMNDQKMKKVHLNGKEKELDLWKAFSSHIKQLSTSKAMSAGPLVDLFTDSFLIHDPTNQRSQRKLREFLFSICGASETSTPTPKKETGAFNSASSPTQRVEAAPTRTGAARESPTPAAPMPSLLQTAFLQHSSPPKTKTYGIASAGLKKKASSEDILKSMASSPTKLSQKLMRGGKMGDYSEFEEEDEVNLENLLGSKASVSKPAMHSSASSRSGIQSTSGAASRSGAAAGTRTGSARADDFDVDF